MAEKIKRSRKSRMKKRPEDWEQLKVELAKELGLWETVKKEGWSGLSAEDSGRLGGVFAARKKEILAQEIAGVQDYLDNNVESSPFAEEVIKAMIFPAKEEN